MKLRSDSPTFWLQVHEPAVELFCNPLARIEQENWHQVSGQGRWDIAALLRDHRSALAHSSVEDEAAPPREFALAYDRLAFRFPEDVFVFADAGYGDRTNLTVWAATPELARERFVTLRSKYLRRPKRRREPTVFYIIKATRFGVDAEPIEVTGPRRVRETDLGLHYGGDFSEWAVQFIATLQSRPSGITILRGEPGTGKTSFIRYLIQKLRRSHRFYYLPVNQCNVLTSPELVEFWVGENERRAKFTKVVILEDAESLLMERGSDNREHLSNLLNISDGLLGEFLRVHLLCTLNCEIARLDPAVTRSGRLLAYRDFRRLSAEEARRLALAKALQIRPQETYTLADIYNQKQVVFDKAQGKRPGFG
jgi:hypothetical protein